MKRHNYKMTKVTLDAMCPACGELGFSAVTTPILEFYRGQSDVVLHHHHKCSSCGGDFATQSDMNMNRRNIIRFRKLIDKIPAGLDFDELKEAIELQLKIAARSIKDAIPNEPPKEQP